MSDDENKRNHDKKYNDVYNVTYSIFKYLNANLNNPYFKSTLAKLRNSIDKEYSKSVDIFPLIYSFIPDYFISNNINLSYEEKSIINTLQLYALHQQSKTVSVVNLCNENPSYENLGTYLSVLRNKEDSTAIDRRFNQMITADTFEGLVYYLRQLIKIYKNESDMPIDYPKLAKELYLYQCGKKEDIKLSWMRQYYFINKIDEKGEKNGKK